MFPCPLGKGRVGAFVEASHLAAGAGGVVLHWWSGAWVESGRAPAGSIVSPAGSVVLRQSSDAAAVCSAVMPRSSPDCSPGSIPGGSFPALLVVFPLYSYRGEWSMTELTRPDVDQLEPIPVVPKVNDSRAFWSEVSRKCAWYQRSPTTERGGTDSGDPNPKTCTDREGSCSLPLVETNIRTRPPIPACCVWGYRCKYPGCNKLFRSTDGARKHARTKHHPWLESVAPGRKKTHEMNASQPRTLNYCDEVLIRRQR